MWGMKIALGSDHAGFRLKEHIRDHVESSSHTCKDFGVFSEASADYPDIAAFVTAAVQSGEYDCGILICGTGIGMSIAANKNTGIRAALCGQGYSAKCAREHNDANILAMGSRVIGPGLALEILDLFLSTPFAGGRHENWLHKIQELEAGNARTRPSQD